MVINEKPPNYNKLVELFKVDWEDGLVVTYGKNIHCKTGISMDLIEHEMTHVRQQEQYGVMEWWERYYVDADFRLAQEKEAYSNQIRYLIRKTNSRYKQEAKLTSIVDQMVRMYGKMITREEAEDFVTYCVQLA
jgi:hypothetical protein